MKRPHFSCEVDSGWGERNQRYHHQYQHQQYEQNQQHIDKINISSPAHETNKEVLLPLHDYHHLT